MSNGPIPGDTQPSSSSAPPQTPSGQANPPVDLVTHMVTSLLNGRDANFRVLDDAHEDDDSYETEEEAVEAEREYVALDKQMDAINSVLDAFESKSDDLNSKIRALLASVEQSEADSTVATVREEDEGAGEQSTSK
eukprot:Opistho-1_new@39746